MVAAFSDSNQEQDVFRQFSPREVAQAVRSLDSRLVYITHIEQDGVPVLVYTFDVLGKKQDFCLVITSQPIPSIVDLYPNAAGLEQEIHNRYGLHFVRSTAEPPDTPQG